MYALPCVKILLLTICFHFLYEGKIDTLSAIDGDKALNCMFPVNVISHPENQLNWNRCPHSACLILENQLSWNHCPHSACLIYEWYQCTIHKLCY